MGQFTRIHNESERPQTTRKKERSRRIWSIFFSHSPNFAEQPKLPFQGRLASSNLRLPFIHQHKNLLATIIGVFENIQIPVLFASLETSSSRGEKNLEANDCSNVAFRIS